MVEFEKAFDLVYGIHDQCGERMLFLNLRSILKNDLKTFKSYEEWRNNLHRRTDLSCDQKWDLEWVDSSIEVIFALVHGATTEKKVGFNV